MQSFLVQVHPAHLQSTPVMSHKLKGRMWLICLAVSPDWSSHVI